MNRILQYLCAIVLSLQVQPLFAADMITLNSLKSLQMKDITMQTQDYSCGAASLSLLLNNYFDDGISERVILTDILYRLSAEELDDRMTQGLSMLDLKQTATRLGYQADGIYLRTDQLQYLKGPVIILLRMQESNHFVILKGISGNRAFLADPVRGHVRLPIFELEDQWKGETLVLGREGFDLIWDHKLALPPQADAAPEFDAYRAIRHFP